MSSTEGERVREFGSSTGQEGVRKLMTGGEGVRELRTSIREGASEFRSSTGGEGVEKGRGPALAIVCSLLPFSAISMVRRTASRPERKVATEG